MAESTVVRTKRDLTWVIQDSGAANTYTPTVIVGDFGYSAPLYGVTQIRDNGALYGVRKADDEPVSCSWTQNLTDVGDATQFTIADVCEERGGWSTTATSTTNQASDVPTYNLVVTVDGTAFGESDKTMTFSNLFFRGSASFGDPATYSVTGTSATATKPTVA